MVFLLKFRDKNGTLKNLDVFKHDRSGSFAIGCYVALGPIFGFNDIAIDDKWDQRFFFSFSHQSFVDFLIKERDVFFSFVFTCRTSTENLTDFPFSYGSKTMKRDESTKKLLAGSREFQVDDLEAFCAR